MDIQFWVWLIVIVITLIARANKKKPESFDSEQREIPNPPSSPTKPVTFEDLLREIQASKAPKPKPVSMAPKQVSSSQYDVEDYDDNLGDENKSLERNDYYSNDKFNETYENAKKAAFSRASLEETMKVEDTEVKFNQFKEYSKKEGHSLASEYANELKNPKNFKRAIILSEILNKRF
jgi:Ribosomal subunit 39S